MRDAVDLVQEAVPHGTSAFAPVDLAQSFNQTGPLEVPGLSGQKATEFVLSPSPGFAESKN